MLIVATGLLRLAFAAATGLGVDESYMVASGRTLRLGYFDHPPAAWWLSWVAAALSGCEAPVLVRLPFIALFALTTWLMYRLTSVLFTARAGLWAAVTLNLAPVFGVTTGTWVLPDGPLDAALLGATLCLAHALQSDGRAAARWWMGSGACIGLALFSKYSAILTIAGAIAYLLTQPAHRRWLARPEPYAAITVALLIFSPVLVWNAAHAWASFAFQGARAEAATLRPMAALALIGGESLYLLPWLWLPLIICFVIAVRRGRENWPDWLLCCLAAPPIVLFALVAVWSRQRVLPHWAAPGYLMLFPLLGAAVAGRLARSSGWTRGWLIGTAAFLCAGVAVVATEIRYAWLPVLPALFPAGQDPALEATDWTDLRGELARRGLLGAVPVVASINWRDAGKIDHALAGTVPVICLNADARQFGLARPAADYVGRDVLLLVRASDASRAMATYGPLFDAIEPLPPVSISRTGHPALTFSVWLGHRLRMWPPPAMSVQPFASGNGRIAGRAAIQPKHDVG